MPVGIAPPPTVAEPVPVRVFFGVEDATVGTITPVLESDGTTTEGVIEGIGLAPVPVGGRLQTWPFGQHPGIPSTTSQNSLSTRRLAQFFVTRA